jgi:O-antigen ligase
VSTEAPPRPEPDDDVEPRRGLQPLSSDVIVGAGLGVAALSLVVFGVTGLDSAPLIAAGLLALAGGAYLMVFASPAWLFSIGLACSMFSGNSHELGLPISPDRIFIAAALGSLALGMPGAGRRERAIVWRPLHAVLAATAAVGILSAIGAGTFLTENGFFSLLDRLGLVPFLGFTLAPLIYARAKDRNALLVVLVVTGGYLGLTAVLEGTHNGAWVWPSYINDPSVGTHFGRARGPFVEPGAMGMALYGCAVAAALAWFTWDTQRARRWAAAVGLLCVVGTIFTLTRSIWLATVVSATVTMLGSARTRKVLFPLAIAGVVVLVAALTFVPGFADSVSERQTDERPLWDRYNTNAAALRMVRAHPLTGVGWQTFEEKAPDYMRVNPNYPLTGVGIPVHNVPQSHAAEMGVLAAALWLTALGLAMGAAILRTGPENLDPWRMGALALLINWAVVASFAPLGYAFPNLLLWLWAGIAAMGHTSRLVPVEDA